MLLTQALKLLAQFLVLNGSDALIDCAKPRVRHGFLRFFVYQAVLLCR